jgi:hypothetical protein
LLRLRKNKTPISLAKVKANLAKGLAKLALNYANIKSYYSEGNL